jgi:hypothetical protein
MARLLEHIAMIKKFSAALVAYFTFFTAVAFADQHVHGYMRSNGTYVQPYYRSSPNGIVRDNFSYKGNVNPYTGAVGTNRYIHDKTSPYYRGPDSHGRVGHNGASNQSQGYGDPNSASAQYSNTDVRYLGRNVTSEANEVSVCPSPHFRMTERDGCQPVR